MWLVFGQSYFSKQIHKLFAFFLFVIALYLFERAVWNNQEKGRLLSMDICHPLNGWKDVRHQWSLAEPHSFSQGLTNNSILRIAVLVLFYNHFFVVYCRSCQHIGTLIGVRILLINRNLSIAPFVWACKIQKLIIDFFFWSYRHSSFSPVFILREFYLVRSLWLLAENVRFCFFSGCR